MGQADRHAFLAWARASRLLGDVLIVTGLTVLARFLSGAQEFPFLHTPDSQFYLSLGVFGDEVTNRAPVDGYYWTKLGLVLPVRALTQLTNVWFGLRIWGFLLTLAMIACTYVVARSRLSRTGASIASLFVALNTVIIGFVGDPYATGVSLALLFIVFATTYNWVFREAGWSGACLLGISVGWIVMVNPYVVVVAVAGFLGLLVPQLATVWRMGAKKLFLEAGVGLISMALTMAAFLILGQRAFPGLDWLKTVSDFVLTADMSVWAEKDWSWLFTETSLLVPASAAVLGLAVLAFSRPLDAHLTSSAGLAIAPLAVVFVYKIWTDGNYLETSYYNAMLWPSALLGTVGMVTAIAVPATRMSLLVGSGALCVFMWIVAGHWQPEVPPLGLAISSLLVVGVAALTLSRRPVPEARAMVAVLGALGLLFQIVQNGRPSEPGMHPRVKYRNSYVKGSVAEAVRRDVALQEWVLEHTQANERVRVWANIDSAGSAAMQLWGPNSVPHTAGAEGRQFERLRGSDADVVVTYSKSPAEQAAMSRAVAAEFAVEGEICRDFPAVGTQTVYACIARLVAPRDSAAWVSDGSATLEFDEYGNTWWWLERSKAVISVKRDPTGGSDGGELELRLQPAPCTEKVDVLFSGDTATRRITAKGGGESVRIPLSGSASTATIHAQVLSPPCVLPPDNPDRREFYAGLFNMQVVH